VTPNPDLLASGVIPEHWPRCPSPVAIPQSILDKAKKNVTFVDNAVGKEVCSESKKIEGVKGKYADLNGQTVTLKVNGSNPFISQVCTALQKAKFNPTSIAGK
jgi:hypothetical protein